MRRFYLLLVLMVISLLLAVGGKSAPVLYYRLFYLIGLLLVASILWAYFNLRRVQVLVERPHGHLEVGDTLESNVVVHNPTSFYKLMLEVTDLTEIPGHETSTMMTIKPYGTERWKSSTTLQKRGTYLLGHLNVTSVDPFGVFRRRKVFPSTEEVTIYPTVAHLPGFYIPIKELRGSVAQRLPSSEVTPVYANVREYVPGDMLKSIHWPATAHRGRLMSRQFDSEVDNQVWIVLDLERDVQAGGEVDNTEETAVSIAASIVARFIQEGWAVGLAAHGDNWHYISAQKGAGLDRYLDMLANVRASGTVPLETLLQDSLNFLPAGSFALMAITASLRPQWVDSVAELKQRGTVANAVFVDPTSYGGSGTLNHVLERLNSRGIDAYLVKQGNDLSSALDSRQLQLAIP